MCRHERLLERIAHIACGYPKTVLAIALLLTLAAWIPPLTAGVDQAFNAARLLPQDVPAARDFSDAVVDFDSIDEAVVVIRLGNAEEAALEGPAGRRARERHLALAGRLGDRLVERLRAPQYAEQITGAFCRKYSEEDRDYLLYEALPRWGLLLIPEEDWPTLAQALSPDAIRQSVAALTRRLRLPGLGDEAREGLILFNASGLGPIFKRALAKNLVADAAENDSGDGATAGDEDAAVLGQMQSSAGSYLVDRERRMLLVAIQPTQPAQSLTFARQVSRIIREEAAAAYAETVPPAARSSVRMDFGGGYEVSIAYMAGVNDALFNTLSTSLVGVILLFGFTYRRPGVLLYVGVPLLMIVSWTTGTGWLAFGQLNLVSCAFAAVLVSLCVDYAIHTYNRYVEERANGCDVPEAFRRSLVFTGAGVFMGMVTTAAAFLGMLATRFSQLVEFGALASIGLVFSIPAMFFVLPALVTLRNQIRPEKSRAHKPVNFGLPSLAARVTRHPKAFSAIGLGLAAVCLLGLALFPGRPGFDSSINSLRPPSAAFDLSTEIAKAFSNRNPASLMLVSYSSNTGREGEAEVLEKAAQTTAVAARLEHEDQPDGRPMLIAYESLSRFIPAPSTQLRLLDYLREHVDFDAARAAFREATERSGLATGLYAELVDFTTQLLDNHRDRVRNRSVLLPSDLAASPLHRYVKRLIAERRREVDLRRDFPEDLVFPAVLAAPAMSRSGKEKAPAGKAFDSPEELKALIDAPGLSHADGVKRVLLHRAGWAVKTKIYLPLPTAPNEPLLNDEWIVQAQKSFDAPDSTVRKSDDTLLTGIPFLTFELGRIVKADFWRLSIGVLAAAFTVLVLFYWRRPVRILTCSIPIVLGVVYLLGIMCLSDFDFNFVNTLAIPIIIGLSVDNGIHLTERFYHDNGSARGIIADTGRAIVVTAFTSMAGFGSLSLVGVAWPVLVGWIVVVGIIVFGGMAMASRTESENRRGKITGGAAILITFISVALWWIWGTGGGVQGLGVLMILGLVTLMAASLVVMPAILLRWFKPAAAAGAVPPDGTPGAEAKD